MNSERKLCVQSTIEKESAVVVLYLHSTSSHNARGKQTSQSLVVLYLHSTSNHNLIQVLLLLIWLYYIFILHQTTTHRPKRPLADSCIISSFYIKPQPDTGNQNAMNVVLYLHSTSNHNRLACMPTSSISCIISSFYIKPQPVTSQPRHGRRCIISSFYIKPQLKAEVRIMQDGCIISSFYIKPQRCEYMGEKYRRCIISSFYIKPQLMALTFVLTTCCIISSFYIKPQQDAAGQELLNSCIISSFYIKPQQ